MGMRQDDFWAQSLQEWDARVAGFLEMHGGAGDDFSDADMAELDRQLQQSAPP